MQLSIERFRPWRNDRLKNNLLILDKGVGREINCGQVTGQRSLVKSQ